MRIAQPISTPVEQPYQVAKIQGCANLSLGFSFLNDVQISGRRRYCNKVLVHECVTISELNPVDLQSVEFIATSDACYEYFEFYKTSTSTPADITIQLNDDDLAVGVLVNFSKEETSAAPMRLVFRLYGIIDDARTLLAQGTLYITPCNNPEYTKKELWTNIDW